MAESDSELKAGSVRNRNRRGRSAFSIIRQWFSGVWSSITTSFSSGGRRRAASSRDSENGSMNFRKSNGRSGKLSITRPIDEEEMLDISKKRNYRSHLLVLGLAGSGKTRMIEQLIRQDLERVETPYFTEIEAGKLTIIEGPGMCTGAGFETDAESVGTLKQYLEQKLPLQIPNAVLVVARFDDNRFEGEGSDFTRMLSGIKYLRKYLTDADLTNLILVLTFADAEGNEEVAEHKLSRFKAAVEFVFPDCTGVRMITLRRDEDMSSLTRELRAVANERQDVDFREALNANLTDSTQENYTVGFSSSSDFLPPQSEIFKIMEQLNGNNKFSSGEDSATEEDEYASRLFPVMIPYSKMHCSDNLVATTWLRKGTLVKMANGSDMEVDNLKVGDRLLNFKLKSDVLESVEVKTLKRWKEEQRSATAGARAGREPIMALIYTSYLETNHLNDERVLQFNRGRVRMMPYVEPIDQVSDEEPLFCIRMNHSDGTFIADSCVFKHRIPPYPESTRL